MNTSDIARQFLFTSKRFTSGAWCRCIEEWEREQRSGPVADAVVALRKAFWHSGKREEIAAFEKAHADLETALAETQPSDKDADGQISKRY